MPVEGFMTESTGWAALEGALVEAQVLGLVGSGPVRRHVTHARGFAEVVGEPSEGRMLDIGSGGGIPGLVLALEWPSSSWVLLDGRARSTEFLVTTVEHLGLGERVSVVEGRAEVVAHDPAHRGAYELVVARGLAGPAVTAECAAGFLHGGGRLVVSEPPGSSGDRWQPSGLAALGMELEQVRSAREARYAVIRQVTGCADRFPRRTGIPAKRPLF